MKNTWLIGGLIGALVLAGLWYARDSVVLSILGEPAGSAHEAPERVSVVSEVPLTTASPYVAVSGSYPQFSNTSDAFNARIAEVVRTAQSEHEKQAAENWQARFATEAEGMSIPDGAVVEDEAGVQAVPREEEKMQFSIEYTVVRNDEKYVSLSLTYGGFAGGAHGYAVVATFTYDRTKKREITIADLYSPQALASLAQDIRPKLITQLAQASEQKESDIDAQWVSEGTDPAKPENFAAFTLASLNSVPGESVTFYFQQYQVAAYVFGMPEITVPYTH